MRAGVGGGCGVTVSYELRLNGNSIFVMRDWE